MWLRDLRLAEQQNCIRSWSLHARPRCQTAEVACSCLRRCQELPPALPECGRDSAQAGRPRGLVRNVCRVCGVCGVCAACTCTCMRGARRACWVCTGCAAYAALMDVCVAFVWTSVEQKQVSCHKNEMTRMLIGQIILDDTCKIRAVWGWWVGT